MRPSSRSRDIDDREADKFAVLQAVLQVLDPSRLPELIAFARQNAGATEKQDQDALLLAAVRRAFDEAGKVRPDDFLATTVLLQALAEDFPWAAVRSDDRRDLTRASKTLSGILARYGVRPRRSG
jgi:MoxR-like ATPase